jgi:hypothetical protein
MDPTSAGNAAAASHTVGGRPVNTSGSRGCRPTKMPSFARDARLARNGAWLMTGPFRPPDEPPVFTPAVSATAAVAPAPAPAPAPAAAASSTPAALDLTSSKDDYSQDSDVEVVVRMQRPAGNKGKTPFICLTGDILRVMQDRLNKNFSQGDPNSTSIETMKSSVGRVIERRVYLLELAGGLDASIEIPNAGEITIKDLLSKVIPIHIPIKITKIKVCQIMTDIWPVLQVVVANMSICKDASHDLT